MPGNRPSSQQITQTVTKIMDITGTIPKDKAAEIAMRRGSTVNPQGALGGAVGGAIGGAVAGAVGGAMGGAVGGAVGVVMGGAVGVAMTGTRDGPASRRTNFLGKFMSGSGKKYPKPKKRVCKGFKDEKAKKPKDIKGKSIIIHCTLGRIRPKASACC